MKKIQHLVEALLLKALFLAFRALPLDMASSIGGLMARRLGPFLSVQKTARRNLSRAIPELTRPQQDQILAGMWDNLGRVAAELPHLPGKTLHERITMRGNEHLPAPGTAALYFSGHCGNWELLPSIPYRSGRHITLVYRHANNPYVERIIAAIRTTQASDMIAKGPRGAFKLARALKKEESICMLVDQKMNDGMPVPFFGRDAMTAPAIAELALRYDLPIVPARVIRQRGAHFEIVVYPPLEYVKSGDAEKDTLAIMTAINKMLEEWIRAHPDQWFWVHNRWPS
jgi:Kdo2-lipid IVA lauroyltransferase/acyltransferase